MEINQLVEFMGRFLMRAVKTEGSPNFETSFRNWGIQMNLFGPTALVEMCLL